MAKMDDGTLKAILSAKITNSLGFFGGRIAKERIRALQYYHGEPFGDEQEGRSQVVSRDVAEVIDGMMPSLMKIFTAGDQIVRFDPRKPQDEKSCEQATDYCNWVWERNGGFANMHDWFKDALLQRLGVIKIWWETKDDVNEEHYAGVTDIELQMLKSDPEVEIVEDEVYQDQSIPPMMMQMLGNLHNVSVRRTKSVGTVKIAPVAPEEFLIERRAVSVEETPFCAHRFKSTRSALIEMGFDKELVNGLAADGGSEYNMERIERFRQEDELPYRTDGIMDDSMAEVWATECYVKVDYDGSGVAQWRKVTLGGETTFTILDNEPCSDHPFAVLTPIPMPHKLIGKSPADQTEDLQLIKSTLWRQSLDNLYQSNNSRVVVLEGQVNLDDLLTARPGGVVRAKSQGAVTPLAVPDITAGAMQMIGYVDTVKEKRTGYSQLNQGVDPNALDSTASGISMMQEAGNQRLELIARCFAETGVKRAFRRILHLMTEYQTEPVMLKLRNQWVQMNPREWSTGYDTVINVGLGTGDKQQQVGVMMNLLGLDKQLIQLQGGIQGPFVTAENIYNKLKKLTEASGHKDVDSFYTDPGNWQAPPQQPPQPNPDLIKIQAQSQADMQALQAKTQIESQHLQMELAAEQHKQELQHQQVFAQNQLEAQRKQLEMQQEADLNQMKIEADHLMEQAKMQHQSNIEAQQLAFDRWKAELDTSTKILVAQISAQNVQDAKMMEAEQAAKEEISSELGNNDIIQMHTEALDAIKGVVQQLAKPKRIIRDANGRAQGVE